MSVQFGVCNCDGEPVDSDFVERVKGLLAPYAPDGISVLRRESSALVYGSFDTACTPNRQQPYRLQTHDWMMWDGRLDNRGDLRRASADLGKSATDVEIVASAYERFGSEAFSQLIGDWAISIFSEARREFVLARDFIGARPLFYRIAKHQVSWSTVLEPLVLLAGIFPRLCASYVAGWLSSFPQSNLTPYEGVFSLPPSSFARIRNGEAFVRRYWNFDSAKEIRYCTDQQYEEHFRSTFGEAVHRRIDSAKPVLAELSGGIDSSSIVCVADSLLGTRDCQAPHLDTVTYYDVAEPNWDELPYARTVEQKRGRVGTHIDVGPESFDRNGPSRDLFRMIPTSPYVRSDAVNSFDRLLSGGGYRVVLSGLGGDEILGGVPTPVPELADLLVDLDAGRFLHQSFRWALAKRKPIPVLWSAVLRQFLPRGIPFSRRSSRRITWLTRDFANRQHRYLSLQSRRIKLTGGRPSFQANLIVVESLRSQLSCMTLESHPPYEWRYPFLDRDFMSFCFSLPRDQMVRPGERRSLMRRALAETVPREILNRSRKAYVSRALVRILGGEYARLRSSEPLLTEELGIVELREFEHAIRNAEQGQDVATVSLLRTLALEDWLRNLRDYSKQSRDTAFPKSIAIQVVHRSDQQLLGRENQKKGGDTHELHQTRDNEARGRGSRHLFRGFVG